MDRGFVTIAHALNNNEMVTHNEKLHYFAEMKERGQMVTDKEAGILDRMIAQGHIKEDN